MLCLHSAFKKGSIAQLVQSMAPWAPGSAVREIHWNKNIGSIAQLVQSICLTSRGSAVRTRVLPHNNDGACSPVCCFRTFEFVTQSWHISSFNPFIVLKLKLSNARTSLVVSYYSTLLNWCSSGEVIAWCNLELIKLICSVSLFRMPGKRQGGGGKKRRTLICARGYNIARATILLILQEASAGK